MVGRGLNKDLSKEIILEVDGKPVDLPSVKGIIILNIMRLVFVAKIFLQVNCLLGFMLKPKVFEVLNFPIFFCMSLLWISLKII